jgi:hypothetical protein
MPNASHPVALLIAGEDELPETQRVWGTGGWLPPEQREALDWLGLVRLLGWSVEVVRNSSLPDVSTLSRELRCIIHCDRDETMIAERVAWFRAVLASLPVLIVAAAGCAGSPLAHLAGARAGDEVLHGERVEWLGPADPKTWLCRTPLTSQRLLLDDRASVWATLDGAPIIAARPSGCGAIATLAFHPSHARDTAPAATGLLKHLLTRGPLGPVAWLDFQQTMILRMDDPGGAQNIYNKEWCYTKLGGPEWAAVAADLERRDARLSIGYVAGWMDDGDPERGELTVAARPVPRIAGRVHLSPLVQYRDLAGNAPGTLHDYAAEYRGIQMLRAQELAEVELHGYTHIHPDTLAWKEAPDRYDSVTWYRELGSAAGAKLGARRRASHPLTRAVGAFARLFRTQPTTLICPGDEWTNEVLEHALDLGLDVVSSYYLALRHEGRFCWVTHLCAPYLDEPDRTWFDAEIPIVGYFHDRDLAADGPGWMNECLDRWTDAGARRLIDFREFAGAVDCKLSATDSGGGVHIRIFKDGATPLVRPLRLCMHRLGQGLPAHVSVTLNNQTQLVQVDASSASLERVVVPVLLNQAGAEK